MKIFSVVILTAFLAGCSVVGAVYDTNEYAAFTSIAHVTQFAKSACGKEDLQLIQRAAEQMKETSAFAVLFTKHEQYNQETYAMAQEIDKLVDEFKAAADTNDKMTEGYCNIKLDSIQHVAEVAMDASASKRRQ